jgi:membrane-anchored glycerophosphoryl diester phosphodiesterase (GDPDase)
MWRYVLLSTPIVGLLLFFALAFEPALFLYLALVLLSFWLYHQLTERTPTALR